jgi:hypothetical protein
VKSIPLTIVLATLIVPIVLAGRPGPKRHIRQLYITMGLLMLVWTFLCLAVYPANVSVSLD